MDKIKVEVIVTNKHGQETSETFWKDYDSLHSKDWNEIVRLLLDESSSYVEPKFFRRFEDNKTAESICGRIQESRNPLE